MNPKELKIKVPWGFVAAKTWGCATDMPVIAIHGWQDNANSFDRIIPLLPKYFYYISLDLPSHGKSTHIPTPTFVTFFDFVLSIKLILDEINLKKYVLLGHSFGAQTAVTFTQIFPQYVTKLIMLDATYYLPVYPIHCLNSLKFCINNFQKAHQTIDTAPSYTRDEILKKILESRYVPISKETAELLVNRSIVPSNDGKYKLTTAQHLKYSMKPPLTLGYQKELVKLHAVKCPHLILVATQSFMLKELTEPILQEFKKNPFFEIMTVEGSHDVHMEHPERVATILEKFLLRNFSNKL